MSEDTITGEETNRGDRGIHLLLAAFNSAVEGLRALPSG